MSIKIKLKPIKRIFFNPSNGYKVLSCEPVGSYPNLMLNQYNNFTLAGTNLGMVDVGDEYELEIRENQRAKYPASYVLVGFADINVSAEGIKITPEQELKMKHTLILFRWYLMVVKKKLTTRKFTMLALFGLKSM